MYHFFILIVVASGILFQSCSVSQKHAAKLLTKAESHKYNQWSLVMRSRVLWAKYLYDKGITSNIIFSGSSVYTPYVESEVMKLYAIKLGVPADHIFTDTLAEHSTQNVYYSYKLAKKLNFEKIALATDPFQSKMLKRFVKSKISKDVGFIPFVFDTLKTIDTLQTNPVVDFSSAYVEHFVPLTERENFFKRFRGTMGKRLDENAYSD